jgi:LPS-assembly protein
VKAGAGAPLLAAIALTLPIASLAQESSDPFESRFRQHPNFQIRFHVPEKGGEVRLTTKKPVQYVQDVSWDGSEEVTVEYQDIKILADVGHYDFPTKTATLTGHVVIDQGPTRLSGSRAVFHLESKTGTIEDATADLAPAYHIVAKAIDKIGEATYRVHDGLFTSCDLPHPEWSFRMSEATVTLDDYARMKNVSFRAGPVPILYTPYMIWPTKENRASGFLVPGVGYTSQRGGYLGLTYYWVTGRSTDVTASVDAYTKGSVGVGGEFRWTPSLESAGIFRGYFIHDTQATVCVKISEAPPGASGFCTLPDGTLGLYTTETKNRWKYRLDHVADDLPWDLRGVISLRDYSDREFLDDFERNFNLSSARQIFSNAFLSRNVGDDSVNLRFERGETFFGQTVLQERIPSLEFFRRTSRLGASPLYLALEASMSGLFMNRGPGLPHGTYGRFDLHPTLSLPWKGVPWLSVTTRAGGRLTEYTNSTDDLQTSFVGQSVLRALGEASVSIVGPSFSRIYDWKIGPFDKFKHVIEPRVDYTYASNVSDPARIPIYDEVDTQLGQNQVRYALVNRLLAKPADPQKGSPSEIASLELDQTYAFTPGQTTTGVSAVPILGKAGPVEAILRLNPSGLLVFDGRVNYDTHVDAVTNASVTSALNWKQNFVNLTWYESRAVQIATPGQITLAPPSDQVRFAAGLEMVKWLRLDTQLNYDIRNATMLEDRSLLTFKASCFTVFVEVRNLRVAPTPRREYRLVVNLKDIGTLLDVNGSLDRIFGQ